MPRALTDSDYFQATFDSAFVEIQTHESVLTFPDPRRVLLSMFQYMYTGEIEVTPESVVPLLNQSEYYQVEELTGLLRNEIEKNMLPKHVLSILKDAVGFQMTEMTGLGMTGSWFGLILKFWPVECWPRISMRWSGVCTAMS